MQALFLKLLNMSITAGWLVLAVILFRTLFKRAPKSLRVILWALVGIRLLFPFSVESAVSLIPSAETVPVEILDTGIPAIQTGIPVVNTVINTQLNEIADVFGDGAVTSAGGTQAGTEISVGTALTPNPAQVIARWSTTVWLIGMSVMLLYGVISYLRIARKVKEAVPGEEGEIWFCDHISTPFILGVFRPRIYLPSTMAVRDMEYVIAHEQVHLKRRDHWWKPLGFMLLTVYWFNPLIWVAFILLCKDIELACDERVIRELGVESKKPYSDALINCSVSRKMIAACPLAFGEGGVKSRIKSVLDYKKTGFWVMALAVALSIVVAVCFLTDPPGCRLDEKLQVFIDCQIASHNQSEKSKDNFCCVDWEVLGKEKSGKRITVYLWALYQEYSYDDGIKEECGSHMPVAITAEYNGYNYEPVEYWMPRDGSYWVMDIRDKFPVYLWGKATDSQRYIKEQLADCERMAKEHFKTDNWNEIDDETKMHETESVKPINPIESITGSPINGIPGEKMVTFVFHDSVDPVEPFIKLWTTTRTFQFQYSGFSSLHITGKYHLADEKLILKSGELTYQFVLMDGDFVFDASSSSSIPKYNYGVNKGMQTPVPDGAVFEWVNGPMPTSDEEVLADEPPTLWVVNGEESVKALLGNYEWYIEQVTEDETFMIIACGSRMTENVNLMESLELMPSYASMEVPSLARLVFGVEPELLSVVCWNMDEEDPEEEAVPVLESCIELKDGNYVYEIKAEWAGHGIAEYGFYTTKRVMETQPISEEN